MMQDVVSFYILLLVRFLSTYTMLRLLCMFLNGLCSGFCSDLLRWIARSTELDKQLQELQEAGGVSGNQRGHRRDGS